MLPPPSEDTRVAELTRRIENLESALRASFTTIKGGQGLTIGGGGDLTVAGGRLRLKYPSSDVDAVYVGDIYYGGVYGATGFLAQDTNAIDIALFAHDVALGTSRAELYDAGNRVIFANDTVSRQGMARPWLDYSPRLVRYADWRTFTLAATDAWETVLAYSVVKQLARLEVCLYASMDTAATTGELRVMVDGVQLGSSDALSFSQGPHYFGPAAVEGNHMQTLNVEVQIKRTTATGGVKLDHAYCRGRQS